MTPPNSTNDQKQVWSLNKIQEKSDPTLTTSNNRTVASRQFTGAHGTHAEEYLPEY